jgi:hypothetical protein
VDHLVAVVMIAMTTVGVDTVDAVTMMDTVVAVTILTMNAAVTLAVVTIVMTMATVALIVTQAPDVMIDTALVVAMTVGVMIAVADTMIATSRAPRALAMGMRHLLVSLVRLASLANPVNHVNHMAIVPMEVAVGIGMELGKWTA